VKKLVGIALVALAFAAAAHAKGPVQATITGPGLVRAIVISGYGENGTGAMGRLTMEGGFFVEVFGQAPDPRLEKEPVNLGPRYRVDYRVPGPTASVTLHQDLYPYAAGGVVTYMRPGQRFWGGQRTHGGWIRAPELAPSQESLRTALIEAGLPRLAPGRGSNTAWRIVGWTAAAMVGTMGAAATLFALRRRPHRGSTRLKRYQTG
jgi:hypothetical protein